MLKNGPFQFLLLCILAISVASENASAGIEIKDLKYKKVADKVGRLIITFDGKMRKLPEVQIREGLIQLEISDSKVWPKIEKKVTLNRPVDTTLTAYQYNKNVVRVRTILPYPIKVNDSRVNVALKEQAIFLNFPVLETAVSPKTVIKKKSPIKKVTKKTKVAPSYDETLIKSLISDKEKKLPAKLAADFSNKKKDSFFGDSVKAIKKDRLKKEEPKKESKFSIVSYVYKFAIFLALILGGIFVAVKFFKKGVLKKNKLGFLTNSDLVSVLNTTYIGPKRSLLLVKAYDKVILLGNSENGIQYLSDVDNLNQLLKDSDELAHGTTFDTELEKKLEKKSTKLKEKVDINKSSNNAMLEGLDNFLEESKKVIKPKNKKNKKRYKDQLKEKVKDLKPLQ